MATSSSSKKELQSGELGIFLWDQMVGPAQYGALMKILPLTKATLGIALLRSSWVYVMA